MAKSIKESVVAAIRAGKHKSREQLAKAAGVDALALSTALGVLRREGVIDYAKPHPRAIDYPSMKVVGDAGTPAKPIKARSVPPSVARRSKRKVSIDDGPPPATPITTDGLLGSPALLLDRSEVAEIRAIVTQARAACDRLETLANTAERAPTIGQLLRIAIDRALPGISAMPLSSLALWATRDSADTSTPTASREAEKPPRASRPRARKLPDILEPPATTAASDEEGASPATEAPDDAPCVAAPPPQPPSPASAPFVVLNAQGTRLTACNTREEADRYAGRFIGAHRIVNAIGDVLWTRKPKVA